MITVLARAFRNSGSPSTITLKFCSPTNGLSRMPRNGW